MTNPITPEPTSDGIIDTQVLVVGAGMGGIVAAVRAARAGAQTLLLEKAAEAGGTMRISGGGIWGLACYQDVRTHIPLGDEDLQRVWISELPAAHRWLDDLGVPVGTNPTTRLPGMIPGVTSPNVDGIASIARGVNPPEFIDFMLADFAAHGGRLLIETGMRQLITDVSGSVIGVQADSSRGPLQIHAGAVILATGGFAASAELIGRYITPHAEQLWKRNSGTVTGDGFLAATSIGAAASTGGFNAFYGHNLPARPASFTREQFIEVSQYYGPAAIAVNLYGNRYCDEGETKLEEALAQDTSRQPEATALLIFDARMWDTYRDPHSGFIQAGADKFAIAKQVGAPTIEADTLAALAEQASSLRIPGRELLATIESFNAAAHTGTTQHLPIPKTRYVFPLDTPPFRAVLVQAGITGSMGGLRADTSMRVLGRTGYPIPRLYAAGIDVGNVNNRHYAGMLSTGLVFGIIAADNAARSATVVA